MTVPLAAKLRPNSLDDILGQRHLLDKGKLFQRMKEKSRLQSTILFGPPGVGKTTLVNALANDIGAEFCKLNATDAKVADIRKIVTAARKAENDTVVFIDEIHRFSKSQQDVVLPVVEDGTIVLFGATTEKPKRAVISTILSRCITAEVKPLSNKDMGALFVKTIKSYQKKINVDKDALKILITRCSGDARKLITAVETIVEVLMDGNNIAAEHVNVAIPEKHLVFDASGNDHFDLAHCYQEAIQHSDVDGALYFLAKWMESDEDPVYICRRMLTTAFEDCAGNPFAMTTAMAACYMVERVGLPEGRIAMSQATCEMAMSKRNKASYNAIDKALSDVRNKKTVHVPADLRAGTSGWRSVVSAKYLEGWERD
jgi:putative ATPase